MHLSKHVIDDKEKVDSLRGHDKDVEATGRLVKTNTLKLTAELESSWRRHPITNRIALIVLLSNTVSVPGLLTYGRGFQHECYNAEKVDVCVVHSELNEDGLGVHIEPGVVIKILKNSVCTRMKICSYKFGR